MSKLAMIRLKSMISVLRSTRSQRGSVLFLILLAVVLFAALSYVVTNSTRGEGKDASTETSDSQASDILSFLTAISVSTQRMVLTGTPIEDVSFQHESESYAGSRTVIYINNRCITTSCRLFDTQGGGLPFRSFEKYAVSAPINWQSTWRKPGYIDFHMGKWPGAGTDKNDIIIQLNAIKPDICQAMNRILAITSLPNLTGSWIGVTPVSLWDGTGYTATNPAPLYGKDTFGTGPNGSGDGIYCNIRHLVYAR